MRYYRVKQNANNLYDHETEYTTCAHELLTSTERKRMFPSIPDRNFEEVTVKRGHTVFSFGARFECE